MQPRNGIAAFLLLTLGSVALAIRCPGPDWYYRKATDKCYYIQGNEGLTSDSTTGALGSSIVPWAKALEECRVRGGKIATFSNAEELEWIKAKLVQSRWYWTGLTYENLRWQWYDGETYTDYVKLAMVDDPPTPEGTNDSKRLQRASIYYQLSENKFVWDLETASTTNANGFICKGDWSTKPWCKVEAGWGYRNGTCYQYNPAPLKYDLAEKRCASGGGRLLVPSSQDEDERVKKWLRLTIRVDKAWLGVAIRPKLATTTIDSVQWSDGSPLLSLPINDWATKDMEQYIRNMTIGKNYCGELAWSSETIWVDDWLWPSIETITKHEWGFSADCDAAVARPFVCEASVNKCPYGWTELDDDCYQFNLGESNLQTWSQAKAKCQAENANLVVIKTPRQQQFVSYSTELLFNSANSNQYWMGLENKGNAFAWVDNSPVGFTNWADSANAKPPSSGECVHIDGSWQVALLGKWRTSPCTERYNYICQAPYTADIRPDEVIHPAVTCEAPYEKFHDGCYLVVKQKMHRDDAQAYCQANGSTMLAVVRTFGENIWLSEKVTADAWLGLRITGMAGSSFTYEYSDGTPAGSAFYKKFSSAESMYTSGSQTTDKFCVAMAGVNSTYGLESFSFYKSHKRGDWYHVPCTENREFVCYHDGTPKEIDPGHDDHSDPACGAGWFRNGDNCYRFYNDFAPWRLAKQICQNSDPTADLLWITSIQEEKFIRDYMEVNKTTEDFEGAVTGDSHWINFYSASWSGVWYWSYRNEANKWHIPMSVTNWAADEPASSTMSSGPRCGLTDPDFGHARWRADRCDNSHAFICKKLVAPELLAPTPPPPPRPTAGSGMVLGCKPGWIAIEGRCIHLNPASQSWLDARSYCRSQGGDLLSLQNAAELSAMQFFRAGTWIGLNALNSKSNPRAYSWSDGSPMLFTPWDIQSHNTTMNCGAITGVNGFSMFNCDEEKPAICEANLSSINASGPVVPTPPQAVGCALYGFGFRERCFYFGVDSAQGPEYRPTYPFNEARTFCNNTYNGDLATLSTTDERDFVNSHVARLGMDFWIGLRETTDSSSWSPFSTWVDGTSQYNSNWAHLEPRTLPAGQKRCVALHGLYTDFIIPGDWYTDNCLFSKHVLCETKRTVNPLEPTPSRPPTTPRPSSTPAPIACPTGWKSLSPTSWSSTSLPNCYKAYLGPNVGEQYKVSWQKAQDFCRSFRGGNLASISSSEVKYYITNTVLSSYDKTNQIWIGLRQNGPQNRWEWSDGAPWTGLEYWHSTLDHQTAEQDCVTMEVYYGKWIPQSCEQSWGWICQIPRGVYSANELIENFPTPIAPNQTCGASSADGDWFFSPDSSECLYFSRKPEPFQAAQAVCRTMGANLVTVTEATYNFVRIKANQFVPEPTEFWIGLYQSDPLTQEHLWIDGYISMFRAWEENEPTMSAYEQCVTHNSASGLWRDGRCAQNLPYICHKSDRVPPTKPPIDPATSSCGDGWVEFRESCYYLSGPENKTHDEASMACLKNVTLDKGLPRGDLVSIHSSLENDFLVSQLRRKYFRNSDQMYDLWIGLREIGNTKDFLWSDGTSFNYANWHNKEPVMTTYRDDCVYFGGNWVNIGHWKTDYSCTTKKAFICKAPKIPNRPPTPPPSTKCAQGYTLFGENCFIVQKLDDGQKTWTAAQSKCRNLGDGYGDLATIDGIFENAEMRLLLNEAAHKAGGHGGNFSAWMGLQEHAGQYAWHNTCPMVWSNFENLYAKPQEPLTCGQMLADGKWNASSCAAEADYVLCERRFEPCLPAFNMTTENFYCPDDFPHECSRSCYYIASGRSDRPINSTWSTIIQARNNCTAKGGHLASIRTEDDQKCLMRYNTHATQGLWIGLYEKKVENVYSWVWENDDEIHPPSTYVNWDKGKPAIYTYNRDICVEMLQTGKWSNRWCYDSQSAIEKGYICEKRKEYRNVDRITTTPLAPTAGSRSRPTVPVDTTVMFTEATKESTREIVKPDPTLGTSQGNGKSSSGPSGGAVAGIVIGVLLLVAIVGAIAFIAVTGRTQTVLTTVRTVSSRVKKSATDRLSPGARFSGFANSNYSKADDKVRVVDDPNYHGLSDSYT